MLKVGKLNDPSSEAVLLGKQAAIVAMFIVLGAGISTSIRSSRPPVAQGARGYSDPIALVEGARSPVESDASAFGFAPERVCGLLNERGLRTNAYQLVEDFRYSCWSARDDLYKDLDTSDALGVPNTIAYSVIGSREAVREMRLTVDVNWVADGASARQTLADYADVLGAQATGSPLPAEARQSILAGRSGSWNSEGSEIQVLRAEREQGYGIEVVIAAAADPATAPDMRER